MRNIALNYLLRYDTPAASPVVGMALALGAGSMVLYALLYRYSADLVQLAELTHQGHKAFFFVPIAVALVFSLIHGAFTGHFWDALGLKPKR
jgi:hypothetical protein